ncbi:MAG TPA: gliding motility-associated C-terminal domain-containing protein [Bacteroidia bacterium]|nr:gliding motility-associated C-terminal domain-containing protein [Bacteroidia bacterium]
MNKRLLCSIALIISLLGISTVSRATHIMGGSINYTYLGLDSATGNYRYLVNIYLFRLCDAGSSLLPIDMNLGIYEDDTLNPGGDKLLVVSTVIPLVLQQAITPPNANDSCTFAPNVCVEEGIYEDTVSVPPNGIGYYFISDRCCRNNNIINLDNPGNAGEAYFAYAPEPSMVNSSPTFAVDPVPFICNTDTVSVLNQAFDPDGDSLAYNFVVPYNGISTGGNPNPNPPAIYPYPVPLVQYAPGYSLTDPFGATGYISMNSATGLAQYYAPNQGFYVIAVEISEYRNGVLIGISRRDIQVIVIPCPINPPPVLSSSTSQTTYTIEEGDTLCFNMQFDDPNGDSIYIAHIGAIFDTTITNPAATFIDSSGAGIASGQFCWETSCDQGNAVPYQFSVIATDNGCPAKVTNIVYTINVQNTIPPAAIIGPDTLCSSGSFGIIYSVLQSGDYTYFWVIDNGTIIGSNTGDSILVNFNGTGTTVISVSSVNHNGCVSDSIAQKVVISPNPSAVAGPDVTICSGDTVTIGSPSTPGYVYLWTPATGLSSATISDPVVTLINTGTTPTTTTYILTTTLGACTNSDTVVVTVNPRPALAGGPDVTLCSGDTVQIGTPNVAGNTYTWTPPTGLSSTTISDPTVTLTDTTGLPYTVQYVVVTQNIYGCSSTDTVNVTVNVIPVAAAGNDTSFCSGDPVTIGGPPVAGYSYLWTPAAGLSSNTISDPIVTHVNTSGQNDTLYFILTVSLSSCTGQDTVMVIVRPSPVSNAGPDQTVCGSATIQLGTTSTTGYSYSWTPSAGLNDSTISDPILTVSNSGTTPDTLVYIVTTTLNGCVTTDTVLIISGPEPTAVAGPDTVICSGNSVVIGSSSTPNYVYTWTPGTGLSSTTVSNPTLTLINTSGVPDTVYYIVSTDLFGCVDSDTIMIIVNPNPVSNAGPDVTLCSGDTIQLGTSSTTGYTYLWTPAAGLSNTTISDPILIVSNTGSTPIAITYTVTTNLNGCITTDDVTITINPQPNVSASANPTSICIGGSATLIATGATGYSWALATSPGNPVSTDSVFVVNPAVTTTYILTGTNGFSCSNSDTITITVNPLPLVQITAAPLDSICVGDTLTLTATGATNYTWSILGGPNIGTGSSIQVSPVTATTYVVVGTDGSLCTNSDTITIIVNPAATLSSISGTLSVCPGVTGVQYWVNNPNPNSTYVWTVTNGTIASGQNSDTITVDWSTVSGSGTVSVIEVTDHGCQSDPVVLPITINTLLTPVAPTGPTTLCANEAQGIIYTLLNTAGSTYNWFAQGGVIVGGNGTNVATVDWTVSGPQVVALWYEETSVTAVDTCFGTSDTLYVTINPAPATSPISGPIDVCISDSGSFSVTNTSSSTYNWLINGGTILSGNGTNAITANWTASGTVTVSVIETNSYGCVGDTVSLTITVHTLPAANAGSDVDVCTGQGVQLNASGGVSYIWSPPAGLSSTTISNPIASPATSTVYIVFVTDTFGCKNSDSVLVTVNNLPVITLTPNSAVCIGSSIQLTAGGGSTYQWSPTGTLNNPNINNPVATPTTTTTYTVIVMDQNTCVDSATVTITVNALPAITASGDTTICEGTNANLSASGGISFNWTPAGTLNNSTVSNPVASPTSLTTYTVTGTDANGCSNTDKVTVHVHVVPQASFTVEDGTLNALTCEGYKGSLTNTSIDANHYQWIFPNGTTSIFDNPHVQLNLSGNNTITLIAYNQMCSDTSTLDFMSTAISQLFSVMPNVFTPNGDGSNDRFKLGTTIHLADCSEYEIYNRWGERVFKSTPSMDHWNGMKDNTGKFMPEGTYYIIVKIADKSFNGTVTMIRNK